MGLAMSRGHSELFCAVVFLVAMTLVLPVAGQLASQVPLKNGPYLESVTYRVINSPDQQVLELLDNHLDMIGDFIDLSFYDTLRASEDVQLDSILRNGYGYFTINCEKYPFNITAFRRAFAYALDKERISAEVWNGFSVPLDSCVPRVNPFSAEGQLSYNYYNADTSYGNYLLDEAGFYDINADGVREAPNGLNLTIRIEGTLTSPIAIETCTIAVAALQAIGINAVYVSDDWYSWPPYPYLYNYDIVFLGASFSDFSVDWLAYEYWSANADEPYSNYPRWQNSTYDSWRNQLLHATRYEDVYAAAVEMQKILTYACPVVVCYENELISAYRTTGLDGYVDDAVDGIPSWWTNYRAHLKGSTSPQFGGTLRIGIPLDVDSFSVMNASSSYSVRVLENLYDSLLRQAPDGTEIPWLAKSYSIQTHADNPAVPEGHTRIVFDILENATWTDGHQITADDVAYSFNLYHNTPSIYYGTSLSDMTAAYNRTKSEVVLEFSTESYWYLSAIAHTPIIPKHVFEDFGPEDWKLWNPDPRQDQIVTSGPFNISAYIPGEEIDLQRNDGYFFLPQVIINNTSTSNVTTTQFDLFSVLGPQHIFITIPSIAVIIAVGIKWKLDLDRKRSVPLG
jgi:ABC-type transport system substrate-binding protein